MNGELHNYLLKRAGFITPSMTSSGGPGTSYFNEGGKLSQIRHLDGYYDRVANASFTAASTFIPGAGNFKLLAPIQKFTKFTPPKFVSKLGGFANKAINKGYDVVNDYRRAVNKYEKLGLNAGFSELAFPMYRLYHDTSNATPLHRKVSHLGDAAQQATPLFKNMLNGAVGAMYNTGSTLAQSAYSAARNGLKSFYNNMTSPSQVDLPLRALRTLLASIISPITTNNTLSNSLRKSIQDGINAGLATWNANKGAMEPGINLIRANYSSPLVQNVINKAKNLTPLGDWKEAFENSAIGRLF